MQVPKAPNINQVHILDIHIGGILFRSRVSPILFLIAIACTLNYACQREKKLLNPENAFTLSTDTLSFDSVFINTTSSTRKLTLYNNTPHPFTISKIELHPTKHNPFQILVDGRPIELAMPTSIAGQDSLIILVRVHPKSILSDTITEIIQPLSITSDIGSRRAYLRVVALAAERITYDTIKGYVHLEGPPAKLIFNNIVIPPDATLSLGPATALYFAPGTGIIVKGQLHTNGKPYKPVTLAGMRLETFYRESPGIWKGIHITDENAQISLSHTIIRSAQYGIQQDTKNLLNGPHIDRSQILFCKENALKLQHTNLTLHGSILAQNTGSALHLTGVRADINHTTLSNAKTLQNPSPATLITLCAQNTTPPSDITITNSIVWGTRTPEIILSPSTQPGLRLRVENSIFSILPKDTTDANVWQHILIADPLLTKPEHANCMPTSKSPARHHGSLKDAKRCPYDLFGRLRYDATRPPDIGALVIDDNKR